MYKLRTTVCFLLLAGTVALTAAARTSHKMQPAAAGAQAKPSRLDTVLSQMDAASTRFKSAQADVRQEIFTKVIQDTDTQTGQVYFLRNGGGMQMGMKMSAPGASPGSPAAQVVDYKDGKLRMLTVGTNQLQEFSAAGHQALAETFLTLGFGGSGSDLKKAWTIDDQGTEQMSDGSQPVSVEKLDLVSKDPDLKKQFTHITIWVDPARSVSLKQVIFFPKGDTRTEYYSNVRLNPKIDQGSFAIKCKNNKCS